MVEFAMVFILLFTVVTLIAQGGLFFSTWLAVTNGAREGARYAAPCLNRTVSDCNDVAAIKAVVNDFTRGFLDQTPPPGSPPCPGPGAGGYLVCVDDSSDYSVTVSVWAKVPAVGPMPLDLTVSGKSTMRLENSPPEMEPPAPTSTPDPTVLAPHAPSGFQARTAASGPGIELNWNSPGSSAQGFDVEWSTSGSDPWTVIDIVTGTSYTDSRPGLVSGTTYYYRVRAYNDGGYSGYTSVKSAAAR